MFSQDPADSFHHDIALLEVSNTFTYNDYVKPACLKQAGVSSGETCWTSGWGSTVGDSKDMYMYIVCTGMLGVHHVCMIVTMRGVQV